MSKQKEILKEINSLVIPIILENVLQLSAGLIATAMIGRLLTSDITAQGICVRITDMLWYLFKGIGVGVTVLMSKTYGTGNLFHCKNITKQSLITAVPLAIFAQIILLIFPQQVLSFFASEAAIMTKAQDYMRILVCGFPFAVIMFIVTATFHGHGNTRTPMLIAAIVNVINIVVGYFLIFGSPKLGMNGAALGLIISQGCGASIGLYLLYNNNNGLFASVKTKGEIFRLDKKCIFEIYSVGIPVALETIFWQLSAILLSKAILSYGSVEFAAYQLGIQAEAFMEMPGIGFGIAATTLTAKAIGKKDNALFKIYLKNMVLITTAVSIFTSLLLMVFPEAFMKLLTTTQELQKAGLLYVFIMGTIQIPQNLSRIYNGALTACGKKNTPMVVAAIGIWGIRMPLALLAAYVLKTDILFIWIIIAFDQVIRFLISLCIYVIKIKKSPIHTKNQLDI